MSKPRAWALALFFFASTAGATGLPCAGLPGQAPPAPAFRLFLELGDGPVLGRERGPVPFSAALRLHPSLVLGDGRFAVGLTGALAYTNPGVETLGGGRVSARLFSTEALPRSRFLELSAAAEALAGSKGSRQLGGALSLDIVDLGGVTLRALRDVHRTDTTVEIAVRLELTRILSKRRTQPFEPIAPPPETHSSFYTEIENGARAAAQASFLGHDDVRDAMGGFVKTWFDAGIPRLTMDRLKPELAASGLLGFGQQADEAIADAESAARRRHETIPTNDATPRLAALLTGWCRAVAVAGGR
jgi:hypothetical protein